MENYCLLLCLHVGSLLSCQIYLLGKALIERFGISSPEAVDTITFYKEPNNVWRQIGKEVWGCNKTIANSFGCCEHRACGFLKIPFKGEPSLWFNYGHIKPPHTSFSFGLRLRESQCRTLPYFARASVSRDKLKKN